MKGSRAHNSASHVNNHGKSLPNPADTVRTKVIKQRTVEVSPTRIRKRHESPPKREQSLKENIDEPENEENSVISITSERSRSSQGRKVLPENPTSIPLSNSSRGDREELVQSHLASTLKQLDAVRYERNQALELNVELEHKVHTLTDRMETALALAEAAKTDASSAKQKRTFLEKRIFELESAHKTILDSSVQLREELVESKLTSTKLMADLSRVNDEKEELQSRVKMLMEDHRKQEHKHAEVQAMKEKLEGLKSAFDAREAADEKDALALKQFVEKEKLAREAEENKNEELRAEILVARTDLENREAQLEESLSQTLSLHEQLKELRREVSDKTNEIHSLKQTQRELDLMNDAALRSAEDKEVAHASIELQLKKELELHHVKFSEFMRKEQEAQTKLFAQIAESKEEAQRFKTAFYESEKSVRHSKGQFDEVKVELERIGVEKQELNVLVTQQKESLEASMCESKELQIRINELEQALQESKTALESQEERHSAAVRDHDSFKAGTESRS